MPEQARAFFLRRPPRPHEQARRELMDSLSRTRVQLRQAYGGFNTARDQDLIESYVYEINSLHARFNYLLRQVKELDAT